MRHYQCDQIEAIPEIPEVLVAEDLVKHLGEGLIPVGLYEKDFCPVYLPLDKKPVLLGSSQLSTWTPFIQEWQKLSKNKNASYKVAVFDPENKFGSPDALTLDDLGSNPRKVIESMIEPGKRLYLLVGDIVSIMTKDTQIGANKSWIAIQSFLKEALLPRFDLLDQVCIVPCIPANQASRLMSESWASTIISSRKILWMGEGLGSSPLSINVMNASIRCKVGDLGEGGGIFLYKGNVCRVKFIYSEYF